MPLSIQNANGVHIASLNGSLDNATGSDLVTTLKNSVEKGSRIILDCTRVPGMDLAGFRHLLALQRWCSMNDGQMVLAGMVPEAWALIVENRCEDSFESSPSVEAAMQTLGASTMVGLPIGGGAYAPTKSDDAIFQTIPPGAMPPMPATPSVEPESEVFSADEEARKNKAAGWDSDFGKTSLEAPASTWAPPPPTQGWEAPASPATPPAVEAPKPGKAKSKGVLPAILAAAAAIAVGWFWYTSSQKAPEIIIEPAMVEVRQGQEISDVRVSIMNGELDREASKLPEGLSFDSGEEFDGGWDYYLTGAPRQAGEHEVGIHAFRGEVQAVPARLTIVVTEVVKLDWVFQSNLLPLDEGRAIPTTSYTKIVNGAKSLKIRWADEAVEGLSAEEMPSAPGSWRLTGTPGRAGKFKGEFVAVKKDGKEESRPFAIDIKAGKKPTPGRYLPMETSAATVASVTPPAPAAMPEPAPAPPPPAKEDPATKPEENKAPAVAAAPTPPPAMPEPAPAPPAKEESPAKPEENKPSTVAAATPAPPLPDEPSTVASAASSKAMTEAPASADVVLPGPTGADAALSLVAGQESASFEQQAVDDRMRTFLMERIEKANSHFTDADKEMLRAIVTRLKDAARVTTVSFDNGQSKLKSEQVEQIKQALSNQDVARLLSNPDCQLLVVGYASNTGSHAANVRYSQQRARAVNDVIKEALGRSADLCGDYGPTDLISVDEAGNRVVEVYAGVIEITKVEQILADAFKNDFNKRHGAR